MDSILDGLNEAQRNAVASPSPVLQVLAPPGSGKTKTLTARVAYLISHEGYRPWNIVVCTFTIKAAREMKERIRGFVGEELERKLILGTFHSVARRYLVLYGHYIGIKRDFGIADSSDTLAILKRIFKRHKYQTEPSKARSRISKVKARSTNLTKQNAEEKQEFDAIFQEYEEALRSSNLLDYDDLLLRCADLLRDHPDCVSNVEAILIDEFQDTNLVQYELMSLFSQRRKRIAIVGDPDQSIYAFRSAEVKNVKRMETQYPQTHVVFLEENYRSSGSILESALKLIEQDSSRPAKKLLPTLGFGERPVLRRVPHPKAEASWIVDEIRRSKALSIGVLSHSDFAILLRSGSQSQAIELALGRAGIPYRMVGGHKFFDRWEVKVLLSYLRAISCPDHNDAVINVINTPTRGIGDTTSKELVEEAERKKIPLWELVLDAAQGRGKVDTRIKPQPRKGLEAFVGLILNARKKLAASDSTSIVGDLIDFLLSRLSFESCLRKKYPDEFETRWENVEELRFQAAQFSCSSGGESADLDDALPEIDGVQQQQPNGAEANLTRFLANVALATDVKAVEEGQSGEQVTISTMHASKGLEWPVVFVASVFDGSMPHSRADDHDEERRLLYVAMTRAQALLYLSCPSKGSAGSSANTLSLSPFLAQPSIANRFELKGPSFTFSTVQELARILRRPSPVEVELFKAREQVERIEDDYWPLDGEDIEVESLKLGFSNANDLGTSYGFASKRRKLEHATSSRGQQMPAGIETTMTMKTEYSTSTTTMTTGFVSAGTRMRELAAFEEERGKKARADHRFSKSGDSHQNSATTKQASSQGSLVSFFAKKTTRSVAENEGRMPLNRDHDSSVRPLKEISSRAAANRNNITDLPQLSPVRKIRTAPFLAPKPAPCADVDDFGKPYILLSSSPPSPDGANESPDCQNLPQAHVEPTDGQRYAAARGDLKPASSFHLTSIAQQQLQQNNGQQKRTLGMRRSVQGWNSSNVYKPFVAPGRPRPDG